MSKRMKTVAVTGSAGFIGRILVQYLLDKGYVVIGVDRKNESAIVKTPCHIEYPISFNNPWFLERIKEEYRNGNLYGIVHLAADSLLGPSVNEPLPYFKNNVCESISFVEYLIKNDIQVPFVFASSAAVYGDSSKKYCYEEDNLSPINPYGRTKLQFEEFLSDIAKPYGFSSTAFRFFNVIGAHKNSKGEWFSQADDQPHVLTSLLRCIKNNETFKINGTKYPTSDGTTVRDFIDVVDICGYIEQDLIIRNELYRTEDYFAVNLGTGIGTSLMELYHCVIDNLDKSQSNISCTFDNPRPGDPSRLVAGTYWLKEYFNQEPQISFQKSIRKVLIAKGFLSE